MSHLLSRESPVQAVPSADSTEGLILPVLYLHCVNDHMVRYKVEGRVDFRIARRLATSVMAVCDPFSAVRRNRRISESRRLETEMKLASHLAQTASFPAALQRCSHAPALGVRAETGLIMESGDARTDHIHADEL